MLGLGRKCTLLPLPETIKRLQCKVFSSALTQLLRLTHRLGSGLKLLPFFFSCQFSSWLPSSSQSYGVLFILLLAVSRLAFRQPSRVTNSLSWFGLFLVCIHRPQPSFQIRNRPKGLNEGRTFEISVHNDRDHPFSR
jgi:hypothetical protein